MENTFRIPDNYFSSQRKHYTLFLVSHVLAFLLIFLLRFVGNYEVNSPELSKILAIVNPLGMLAGFYLSLFFIGGRIRKLANEPSTQTKFDKYAELANIRRNVLRGPLYLALASLLLTPDWVHMVVILSLLVLGAIFWPSCSRCARELNLNAAEIEKLRAYC